MPWIDAMASVTAKYRNEVLAETWGHLAPKKNRIYKGTILFTCTEYGDFTVIRANFQKLPDSPWFYEALNDFISEYAEEQGCIYLFQGTFKNYEFAGEITKVNI